MHDRNDEEVLTMTVSTHTFATETILLPAKRFFRTPKGLLLVVLALLTAVAAAPEGVRLILPSVFGATVAAALLDVALARVIRGAWFFPSGALLSGLIVALIVAPTEPVAVTAITAMLAVNSKYLFRARGKHIFNPAALALVAAYFLFATGQSWWGALPNLPAPFVIVLLVTGIFIADRVNKLPMVLVFLGGYVALLTLVAFLGGAGRTAEIFRAPDINAVLFFAFFMLTDPPTSPARYRDQVIYALLVAVACSAIFLLLGAVYFLPAGLLIGNGWEAWRRTHARTRVKTPGSRAATRAPAIAPAQADQRARKPVTDRRVLAVEHAAVPSHPAR
jgi:Na+-translocating ferredoxin:NAD+ oxidoreductase RnfD subunit